MPRPEEEQQVFSENPGFRIRYGNLTAPWDSFSGGGGLGVLSVWKYKGTEILGWLKGRPVCPPTSVFPFLPQ